MPDAPAEPEARPTVAASGEQDIGRRVLRGTFWVALSRWGTMLVSWPTTILLARLLDPSDYGYLALVTVFTRFGRIVAEAGVSSTVVLGPPLSESQYGRLHGLSTALFVGVGLLLACLAVPIERYYDSEGLRWVLLALTTSFLAEGLMVVPIARMRRDVRFRELASSEALRVLADAAISLTLALSGFRYWALVGGYLGGTALQAVLILRATRMVPARPGTRGIEETVASARRLLVGSLSTFVATSADAWVGASVVGTTGLGGYSYMNSLARSPIEKISGIVTYASGSLLGNIGQDRVRVAGATLRIARIVSLVMFPVFAGIALVAEPLVLGLLGEKWFPYVTALQVLCVYAASYPLLSAFDQAIIALGQTRTNAINGLIYLAVLPASFFLLGGRYGATGLAVAWLVPLPLVFGRLLLIVRRVTGIGLRASAGAVGSPAFATALMGAGVLIVSWLLGDRVAGPLIRLGVLSTTGAVIYAIAIWLLAADDVRWLVGRLRAR